MRCDLSDEEWAILARLLPAARRSGRVDGFVPLKTYCICLKHGTLRT